MREKDAIELLRSIQNPEADYATLVCAPAFAYGHKFVYPEPEDYAIEEAIKALEEIHKYRSIGTVEECREARKKQIPQKPGIQSDGHKEMEVDCFICPVCDSFLGYVSDCKDDENYQCDYCMNCGQAIDWSDWNDRVQEDGG